MTTYKKVHTWSKTIEYSVVFIIYTSFQAINPSQSKLLLGLKLIQPNWYDYGRKDLIQAIYMNGQVDFSTDEGKRAYACPKYGGSAFADWSDVDEILAEESVAKKIFFVY